MSGIFAVAPDVAWVESEDRVALLHLDSEELPAVLTDSSAAIWTALDGTRDTEAIVAHVAGTYEVNPDEIREQVLAFLTDLEQRHLIVRT